VSGPYRHRPADVELARVLPLAADRTRVSPRFPGFRQIAFSARTRWDYAWREAGITNGEADPVKSGVVRIALSDPVEVDFGLSGTVAMFEVTCSPRSGTTPGWWPQWRYLGVKDGALYGGAELEDGGDGAAILFDSKTGEIHPQGFMGRFSHDARPVAASSISNPFLSGPAVIVEEPAYGRGGETAGRVQICEGELHDYSSREFYLPGKGFGGWSFRGTSIYAGGGYVDCFETAVEVGLTSVTL
jgi:hypothetical protein